ncbi:MAG TPA: type II secretion system protein GspN [Candidatus Binataceae bacterium]|nr:type II secretion system protein GspN [Candidatus Binataceae bacterium]
MPDFNQYLSREYWRAHQLELAYGIAAFVLFLAFMFATFPYGPALKAALGPMGLRFESSEQSLAFPFGARLDNVEVRSLTPGPALFTSESVRIWPALGSLLLFHPGISASAQAYGGNLKVSVHRSGDGAAVSFDTNKLDLAALHLLKEIGVALGGELSGEGKITIDPVSPGSDSGAAHLTAKGFLIRIPGPMPALGLGDVELTAKLNDGTVQLSEVKSSGGDLTIDGHGTIRLDSTDWRQSALAIDFTLTPSPTARQRLAFLLNFLPHPPGTGPYKLVGTISSPLFS